jgi:hypothetical protein
MNMRHEFVESAPEHLEDGCLYISLKYSTALHNCCCGCGNEVVTELSPNNWKLTQNGGQISLRPSIGNWDFPCQSHYWITDSKVRWAERWSKDQIDAGRLSEKTADEKLYGEWRKQVSTSLFGSLYSRLRSIFKRIK